VPRGPLLHSCPRTLISERARDLPAKTRDGPAVTRDITSAALSVANSRLPREYPHTTASWTTIIASGKARPPRAARIVPAESGRIGDVGGPPKRQHRTWRHRSRLPAAKTWDQLRMRTECRNPVGQNGSAFTSASTTSGPSVSTTHSPPAGSPDNARNGPAALIRSALFSRNDK